MAVDKWLDKHTDTLDADVFTGDCLFEKENRDHLQYFLDRWNRQIKSFEESGQPGSETRNLVISKDGE